MPELDAALERIERTAALFCLVAAALALIAAGGRLDVAIGVLGGGVLIGTSYWTIKSGVDTLVSALPAVSVPPDAQSDPGHLDRSRTRVSRLKMALLLAKITGRYALLAVIAYVMIARLRLHPIGLLVGVSSIVAAVAAEAIRNLKKN
jgi:hypothetical protein